MTYLGIEIGGTKLQLGIGPGDGTLVALWRGTIDPGRGGDGIRAAIVQALPELLERARLLPADLGGAGIGFGGPIDDDDATVITSHQIAGWDGFPLASWLSELLGRPAALGNDADVAGLAEALFGAGRGLSPIFYITIGSGIGGGLIIDGAIQRGCGRGAAEIGQLRVAVPVDGGVRHTPLERVASGWAIEQSAHQERARSPALSAAWAKVQGAAPTLTAAHLAAAARAGDGAAGHILSRAWEHLAEAICQVIALVCPRRIVIGGGVALMGDDVLFGPLRKLVAERVFVPFADCYEIVPAALGEEVVVHGALALARQRFG